MNGKEILKLLARRLAYKSFRYIISVIGGTTLAMFIFVMFAVLAVYGALPTEGGSPLSQTQQTKKVYQEIADEYNPEIKSSNGEERKYLLQWGFIYVFDLFRSQSLGKYDVENNGQDTANKLKPYFDYKESTVTVRTKDKDGKTETHTYTVTLLTKADTYQGTYVYHYKWKRTETVTKEVLDRIEYIENWQRFDSHFIKMMEVKTIKPQERPMIINAGQAFTEGKEHLEWMAGKYVRGSDAVLAQLTPELLQVFKDAAQKFGAGDLWHYFVAVAKTESDFNPAAVGLPNDTGELAQGMMQILPSTFRKYAQDGDNDGECNPFDTEDSIYTGINYLVACGAVTNIREALYSYNHSWDYVNTVMALAESYKLQDANGSIAGYCFPVGGSWSYSSFFGDGRKRDDSSSYGHQGVDIAAPHGQLLYAFTSGKIRISSSYYGGKELWINALDGASYYYCHMSGYIAKNGDTVKAGDPVGYVGATGPAWKITGPHLHFGIWLRGQWVDPLPALENSRGRG